MHTYNWDNPNEEPDDESQTHAAPWVWLIDLLVVLMLIAAAFWLAG